MSSRYSKLKRTENQLVSALKIFKAQGRVSICTISDSIGDIGDSSNPDYDSFRGSEKLESYEKIASFYIERTIEIMEKK